MREYLKEQIEARRQRLKDLDRQRTSIESELRAYEDAYARVGGTVAAVRSVGRTQCATLSRTWTVILYGLVDYKHFNASEIVLLAARLIRENKIAKTQNRGSARAQLSLLTRKGIIQRRGGGNYVLSDETRLWLKLSAEDKVGTGANHSRAHLQQSVETVGPELAARVQPSAADSRQPLPSQGATREGVTSMRLNNRIRRT